MKFRFIGIRTLVCGLGFMCAVGSCAHRSATGQRDPLKFSEQADRLAEARAGQIEAEIEKLKGHPWAGNYYVGDGLGVNVSLLLAPEAGFLFEWHGCMGLYDRNYGSIVAEGDRVKLQCQLPNNREGFQGIASEFVVVPWGERCYLVPRDEMTAFCTAVNSGREPRSGKRGLFTLRRGDESKPVMGRPLVPAEFRDRILEKPLEANIIEQGPSVSKSSYSLEYHETPITLNVGRSEGVFEGMEFYTGERQDEVYAEVKVSEVTEHSCKGAFREICGKNLGNVVGWRLSTSSPLYSLVAHRK